MVDSYEELHAKAKKSLEAHLQICPECEQYRGSVHQMQQFLDQWEDINRPIDIKALHRAIRPLRGCIQSSESPGPKFSSSLEQTFNGS